MTEDPGNSRVYGDHRPDSSIWDDFELSEHLDSAISKESFLTVFALTEAAVAKEADDQLSPDHPFVVKCLTKYVEQDAAYKKAKEQMGFNDDPEKTKELRRSLLHTAAYFSVAYRVLGLPELEARCPYLESYDRDSEFGILVESFLQARCHIAAVERAQYEAEMLADLREAVEADGEESLKLALEVLADAPEDSDTDAMANWKQGLVEEYAQQDRNSQMSAALLWSLFMKFGKANIESEYPHLRGDKIGVLVAMTIEHITERYDGSDAEHDDETEKDLRAPNLCSEPMANMGGKVNLAEEVEKLIALEEKGSDIIKTFNGFRFIFASLISYQCDTAAEVEINRPRTMEPNFKGSSMRFRITGEPLEERLELQVLVGKEDEAENESTIHKCALIFWPSGRQGVDGLPGIENLKWNIVDQYVLPENLRTAEVINYDQISSSGFQPYINIEFDTPGGDGHQLDWIDARETDATCLPEEQTFARETNELLNALLDLSFDGKAQSPSPFTKAHVKLSVKYIERAYFDVDRALTRIRDGKVEQPWMPYCKKGKAKTQAGMLSSRQEIHDYIPGIIPHNAKITFSSLEEWSISQVYAARVEQQREQVLVQKLEKNKHTVAFYNIDTKFETVIAALLINQEGEFSEQYNLPAGSRIELSIKVPKSDINARSRCTVTVIDNIFSHINSRYTVAQVHMTESNMAPDYTKICNPIKKSKALDISCWINIRLSTSPMYAQIDGINKFCEPSMSQLHATILGRTPRSLPMIDPTMKLSGDRNKVKALKHKAHSKVVEKSNIRWNEAQKEGFLQCFSLPGAYSIFQGVPGAGKSLTICGMIHLYRELGINCLIVVPTYEAADSLMESTVQYKNKTGAKFNVVRAYTTIRETAQFKRRNDPPKEASDVTEQAERQKAYLEGTETMIMLQLIKNQRDAHQTQRYGLPQHSVEARVIQQIYYAAYNERLRLMIWMTQQRIEATAAFLGPDLFSTTDLKYEPVTDQESGCQVEMYGILRGFVEKMDGTKPFKEWPEGAENILKQCFSYVVDDIITNSPVVIATPACAGSDSIKKHFAARNDVEAFVLMIDEAMRDTEVNAVVAMSRLTHRDKLAGVLTFGDRQQPGPLVLSKGEHPGYNEFAHQLALPQPNRLLLANHPKICQWEQNRMRDILNQEPSAVMYDGMMITSTVAAALTMNPNFEKGMKDFLQVTDDRDVGLCVLSIKDAKSFRPPGITSRRNPLHGEMIIRLLQLNNENKGYSPDEIMIITFYKEQVDFIKSLISQAISLKLLPFSYGNQVLVKSVAAVQGRERSWVIGDGVVHESNTGADLGFVADSKNFNVFLTRAKTAFTALLPEGLATGAIAVSTDVTKKVPWVCKYVQRAEERKYLYNILDRPRQVSALTFPLEPAGDPLVRIRDRPAERVEDETADPNNDEEQVVEPAEDSLRAETEAGEKVKGWDEVAPLKEGETDSQEWMTQGTTMSAEFSAGADAKVW